METRNRWLPLTNQALDEASSRRRTTTVVASVARGGPSRYSARMEPFPIADRPAACHPVPRRALTWLAACLGAILTLAGCETPIEPADLILRDGRIVTLDAKVPEAQALAVRAGRIVACGSNADIDAYRGARTRVLELGGRLAIPGFIESHAHFASLGRSLMNVDLMHVRSWDEAVQKVAEAATHVQPGEWILGRGWHQEKWDERPSPNVEGYPTHESLSRVSPDNPVVLTHASGHAAIVNAAAMQRAGIHESTPDPEGGKILRDLSGRPSGVLRETAQALVQAAYQEAQNQLDPEAREAQARRALELADDACLAYGVTTFQDAGSTFETVDRLTRMYAEDRIDVRLWVMLREANAALAPNLARYRMLGAANDHLTVRAIKVSLDGALGSHGAWLLEPYADQPHSTGHNTTPIDSLDAAAGLAITHGFQLCVHAIGDRGNRETLDAFQRAFTRHPDKTDLRWRVEHAQHLHPDDIPRFAGLGVIASMQGVHCTSDGPWVPLRIGDQRAAEGAYVWRKLLDSGAIICNGTDAPVEDLNPIPSFYASVTRQLPAGDRFYPEQCMTRMEALRSYTLDAAYAGFEEALKGSLTPGKLADVVVLSHDILTVPEDAILETQVVYTIIGGEVVYERP
jgi:predicted amidohydrolase YtcJ